MKKVNLSAFTAIVVSSMSIMLIACGGGSKPIPDLDQALDIASLSIEQLDRSGRSDVSEENAMSAFAAIYADNLNSAQPPLHTENLGVASMENGSFDVYEDSNHNGEQDSDEEALFNVEVDTENDRLIASAESYVRDRGFSGGGLLMGYLIGSMLGRQRATGTTPSSKRASPKMSAKQRAGSGSHSRGK